MSLVLLALHLVLILLLKSMYQIPSLSTIPSGRFWIVGDLLWDGGWPSCGWLWVKSRCQISSLVQYLLVDFGRWVTILGMVSDHPWVGWWPPWGWYVTMMIIRKLCTKFHVSRCTGRGDFYHFKKWRPSDRHKDIMIDRHKDRHEQFIELLRN